MSCIVYRVARQVPYRDSCQTHSSRRRAPTVGVSSVMATAARCAREALASPAMATAASASSLDRSYLITLKLLQHTHGATVVCGTREKDAHEPSRAFSVVIPRERSSDRELSLPASYRQCTFSNYYLLRFNLKLFTTKY